MKLLALTALASLLVASVPAEATVYTFTQGGYADGATAFGSFTGSDLDGNGEISSFVGEVSDFSFNFSGGVDVAAFTLNFASLTSFAQITGLVYDLNGVLGDGFDDGVFAANQDNILAVAGFLPTCDGVTVCSVVEDKNNNTDFSTAGLTVIASVPEPAIWAMMIAGFGLVGMALRRRAPFSPPLEAAYRDR